MTTTIRTYTIADYHSNNSGQHYGCFDVELSWDKNEKWCVRAGGDLDKYAPLYKNTHNRSIKDALAIYKRQVAKAKKDSGKEGEEWMTSRYDEYVEADAKDNASLAEGGQVGPAPEMTEDQRIASIIIQQLGGRNRLNIMTGAYNFYAVKKGVAFRIKNQKANYIKIVLEPTDLYAIEIGRIRGNTYKIVYEHSGIYNDQLKGIIEKYTGMYLSLKDGGRIDVNDDDHNQDLEHLKKEAIANAKRYGRNKAFAYLVLVEKEYDGVKPTRVDIQLKSGFELMPQSYRDAFDIIYDTSAENEEKKSAPAAPSSSESFKPTVGQVFHSNSSGKDFEITDIDEDGWITTYQVGKPHQIQYMDKSNTPSFLMYMRRGAFELINKDATPISDSDYICRIGSEIVIKKLEYDRNVKMKLMQIIPLKEGGIEAGMGKYTYKFVGSKDRVKYITESALRGMIYANQIVFIKQLEDGGPVDMTEREFLDKYFGVNVFPKEITDMFEIENKSSSNKDKVAAYIDDLKQRGFTVKKKSYSDFVSIMGAKKKMAAGGPVSSMDDEILDYIFRNYPDKEFNDKEFISMIHAIFSTKIENSTISDKDIQAAMNRSLVSKAKQYKTEFGKTVLGFESISAKGFEQYQGCPIIYFSELVDISDSFMTCSGILFEGEIVNGSECFDDWFANEEDALDVAYKMANDVPVYEGGNEPYADGGELERKAAAVRKAVEIAGIANSNNIRASNLTLKQYSEKIFDATKIAYPVSDLALAYEAMKSTGYADGGQVTGAAKVLVQGYPYFLKKIDSTHLYVTNTENAPGMASHVGQFKDAKGDQAFYNDIKDWLQGKIDIEGREYADFYADGGQVDGAIKVSIEGYPYYLKKIDVTHLFVSNNERMEGTCYHIGQFRTQNGDQTFYNDIKDWLKGKIDIAGRVYEKFYADGGELERKAAAIKTAIEIAEIANKNNIRASHLTLKQYSEKIFDATKIAYPIADLALAYEAMKSTGYKNGGELPAGEFKKAEKETFEIYDEESKFVRGESFWFAYKELNDGKDILCVSYGKNLPDDSLPPYSCSVDICPLQNILSYQNDEIKTLADAVRQFWIEMIPTDRFTISYFKTLQEAKEFAEDKINISEAVVLSKEVKWMKPDSLDYILFILNNGWLIKGDCQGGDSLLFKVYEPTTGLDQHESVSEFIIDEKNTMMGLVISRKSMTRLESIPEAYKCIYSALPELKEVGNQTPFGLFVELKDMSPAMFDEAVINQYMLGTKESLDANFWSDLAHLWKTNNLRFENNKWVNTGLWRTGAFKESNTNPKTGHELTDVDVTVICSLANSYNVTVADIKTNNPDFTTFEIYNQRGNNFKAGGQIPGHFASGKNMEVFGYQTQNFDISKALCNLFTDIINNSSHTEQWCIKHAAIEFDDVLSMEKYVVRTGEAIPGGFKEATKAALLGCKLLQKGGYDEVASTTIMSDHLLEIARRLPKQYRDGGVVKQHILQIGNDAVALDALIHGDSQLEDWVQSRIARAATDMGDVVNYLNYELDGDGIGGDGKEPHVVKYIDLDGSDDQEPKEIIVEAVTPHEAREIVQEELGDDGIVTGAVLIDDDYKAPEADIPAVAVSEPAPQEMMARGGLIEKETDYAPYVIAEGVAFTLMDKHFPESRDQQAAEYAEEMADYLYKTAQKQYKDSNATLKHSIGKGSNIGRDRFYGIMEGWGELYMLKHPFTPVKASASMARGGMIEKETGYFPDALASLVADEIVDDKFPDSDPGDATAYADEMAEHLVTTAELMYKNSNSSLRKAIGSGSEEGRDKFAALMKVWAELWMVDHPFEETALAYAKGGEVRNLKFGRVMHEFKEGKLTDRWGNKVTDRGQALAIAYSSSSPKMKDGGEVNGWVKQKEWHGNPSLGYESWKKNFKTPGGRAVPVYLFGKEGKGKNTIIYTQDEQGKTIPSGNTFDAPDWSYCVSAGPNSDYTHSGGFYPETPSLQEAMDKIDALDKIKRLIYESGGTIELVENTYADGTRSYKLGDKYSEDFDYDGLMATGLSADATWSIEDLKLLQNSFTDVNYHKEAALVGSVIKALGRGGKPAAKAHIKYLHEKLIDNITDGADDQLQDGDEVYEVSLEAVPNHDFGPEAHESSVRIAKHMVPAKSIDDAVRIVHAFCVDNDLGGGNFINAKLYVAGVEIGHISYNGRVCGLNGKPMVYEKGGVLSVSSLRSKTKEELAQMYQDKFGLPALHQDIGTLIAALHFEKRIKNLTDAEREFAADIEEKIQDAEDAIVKENGGTVGKTDSIAT